MEHLGFDLHFFEILKGHENPSNPNISQLHGGAPSSGNSNMMKFQGAKKTKSSKRVGVGKGSGGSGGSGGFGTAFRKSDGSDSSSVRAVRRCGLFGRISSVRRTAARSVVSVRSGTLKRVKGKKGKNTFLQAIDEAKVKHNRFSHHS